jgi:hypothetical protein
MAIEYRYWKKQDGTRSAWAPIPNDGILPGGEYTPRVQVREVRDKSLEAMERREVEVIQNERQGCALTAEQQQYGEIGMRIAEDIRSRGDPSAIHVRRADLKEAARTATEVALRAEVNRLCALLGDIYLFAAIVPSELETLPDWAVNKINRIQELAAEDGLYGQAETAGR